ncbi:DUF7410 domain-containing protein [Haloglomus litoreum]|uniref:DUF7410 domain-containing protein n=1 Tax=Haloglomus litoreum TaxID=3034026 RepID=UPI0023E7C6F7|nr:hypothetical protein [Haloglomus sp. DT116]
MSTTVPHDTDRPREESDTSGVDPPETTVPPGEEPAVCPYCDRPFRRGEGLALHVGERHAEVQSEAERAAFESAREAEGDELFMYHLRVIAALGVLYAVLVLLYMIVLA